MSRVLLTGASGFVGRHCLPLLAAKGHEVHAVSRHPPPEMASPNVRWHQADLLKPGCASQLIEQARPDALLHLAWYAVPGSFWEAPENLQWVRTSLELFEAFAERGGKRAVAAGSCAEYVTNPGECTEDATSLAPTTLYGTCKHALQTDLRTWSQQVGLSSAWGRIFFLYGPHEHPSRLVAYVMQSLLRGEPALCSQGQQVLDYMHIEDAASAFVALLESDVEGPVNIGSGTPVVVRDLIEQIGLHLSRLELVQFGARPDAEPIRLWADTKRLVQEVGWSPRYDLARGIEQTAQWWRGR